MNYYQFHIGDYRSATAHLTNEEDLTYRRLLDMYYDSEQPIPKETQWVSRRLRVGCEVVSRVLQDFFKEEENGWVHRRCELEIAGYRDIVVRNRNNGKLGGRPRKTQSVSSGNPVVTLTSNQEPVTSNQKEKKDTSPKGSFLLVEEIFNYWKEKTGKKKAQLGGALKSKILGRIKDGYSVEDIKQAIDGNSGSSWHQGQNDKNTKYNGLDLICRDSTKIDYFMGMAQKPTEEDNVARWARIEANIGK